MDKLKVVVAGSDLRRKKVVKSGNSGRVYVPREWIGCEVAIVRLSDLAEPNDSVA